MSAPVEGMSATALKGELQRFGVTDFSPFLEKQDLVAKLLELRRGAADTAATPQPPTCAASGSTYGEMLFIGNTKNPSGLVTLLHGLGDTARGWEAVASELAGRLPSLLFLLPTAPHRPVTLNMAMPMPAWYDISGLTPQSKEDTDGMSESASYMHVLTQSVCKRHNIRATNVVFGGFSQGAVVSIFAGLTSPIRPRGIVALSGYLGGRELLRTAAKHKDLPLLMCHGGADPMIPIQMSMASLETLKQVVGVKDDVISYKSYPRMGHAACPDELRDIHNWLSNVKWESG